MLTRLATSAIIVPLFSIVGHEVYSLTANLRFPVAPTDPSKTMAATVYNAHGAARDVLQVDPARAQPMQPAAKSARAGRALSPSARADERTPAASSSATSWCA